MFQSLVEGLNEKGGGVRAYDAVARAAAARIPTEPDAAAALFLILVAAQRFVDSYDDQPLTVEAATAEFEAFKSHILTLDGAFAAGSAEERLDALNQIAMRLSALRS